jgi:hypothetical protein
MSAKDNLSFTLMVAEGNLDLLMTEIQNFRDKLTFIKSEVAEANMIDTLDIIIETSRSFVEINKLFHKGVHLNDASNASLSAIVDQLKKQL